MMSSQVMGSNPSPSNSAGNRSSAFILQLTPLILNVPASTSISVIGPIATFSASSITSSVQTKVPLTSTQSPLKVPPEYSLNGLAVLPLKRERTLLGAASSSRSARVAPVIPTVPSITRASGITTSAPITVMDCAAGSTHSIGPSKPWMPPASSSTTGMAIPS